MSSDGVERDDEAALERYLSGLASDQEAARLLARLVRSPALRARLDELRERCTRPGDIATIMADAVESSADEIESLPTDMLAPTPPLYRFGRVLGGQRQMMGDEAQNLESEPGSLVFGPDSLVEIEVEPTAIFDAHQPVSLLVADRDGWLRSSGLIPAVEDDVLVFSGRGSTLFAAPGEWTLCVFVGVDRPDRLVRHPLELLRAVLPPERLLTRDVIYRTEP